MVVALRLLGAAVVGWEADHSPATAEADTTVVHSAPIADCTAPDIVEFAIVIIAASPNSAAHID